MKNNTHVSINESTNLTNKEKMALSLIFVQIK